MSPLPDKATSKHEEGCYCNACSHRLEVRKVEALERIAEHLESIRQSNGTLADRSGQ